MARRGRIGGIAVAVAFLLAGCAGGPAPRGGPRPGSPSSCWDLRYRVRFTDGERTRTGRLVARACGDGRLLAELRGRIGPPVLVAAVREGKVRLLLPRRHEAVDGPDDAGFWRRWTGVPLPGSVLLEGRPVPAGGRRPLRVAGWTGEVRWSRRAEDPCPFPVRLEARDPAGGFLVAERTGARPAADPPAWPTVPGGFARRGAEGAGEPR